MDTSGVIGAIYTLYERFKWSFLLWFNIVGLFLYRFALKETQDLFLGSIPEQYAYILWTIALLFLKVNLYLFNFAFWGGIAWGLLEVLTGKGIIASFVKSIFNNSIVINLWYLCVFIYIAIGNMLLMIALVSVFSFQGSQLFDVLCVFEGERFSFQQPPGMLVWPAVLFGTAIVASGLSFYRDYETYKEYSKSKKHVG